MCRAPDGTDNAACSIVSQTTRGYTGHEMLDSVCLINMNARIQDPQLGRFLSPDAMVPDETYGQSYNRYSYVLNNPLAYTDPTGHITVCTYEGGTKLCQHAFDGDCGGGCGGGGLNISPQSLSAGGGVGGSPYQRDKNGKLQFTPEYQKQVCSNYNAMTLSQSQVFFGFAALGAPIFVGGAVGGVLLYGWGIGFGALSLATPPPGCG